MYRYRSVGLYFFLCTITLGIYGVFFWNGVVRDANALLEGDGKHTPGVAVLYPLSFLTLGIYFWIWRSRFYRRMTGASALVPLADGCAGCAMLLLQSPLFPILFFVDFVRAQKELIDAFNVLVFSNDSDAKALDAEGDDAEEAACEADEEQIETRGQRKRKERKKEKEKNTDELYW